MTEQDLAITMLKEPENLQVIMDDDKPYNFGILADFSTGLTYIGQMIAHDIVPPRKTNALHRLINGELNLDSLYGMLLNNQPKNAPGDVALFDHEGRFKLGRKDNLDLYRIDGVAQIPEPRNDENIINAQLHNLWLRLHNKLLDKGHAKSAFAARRLVCLTFQLVVVEDFLRSVLSEKVFEHFFVDQGADVLPQYTSLPSYFSKASFRFGHSMVRDSYTLNGKTHSLRDLFRRNKDITDDFILDWHNFFNDCDTDVEAEPAFATDSLITSFMGKVPIPDEPAAHIAKANIAAGREANLPLGLAWAQKYQSEMVKPLKSTKGATFEGFHINHLPLWPYILLEAQSEQMGKRLGGLGSLLNAQVLRTSMIKADFSIFKYDAPNASNEHKDSFKYSKEGVFAMMDEWGDELSDMWRKKSMSAQSASDDYGSEIEALIMSCIVDFVNQ